MLRQNYDIDLAAPVAAVEQTADGIVVTDTTGEIRYASSVFTAMTEYTSGEAIGRNARIPKSHSSPAKGPKDDVISDGAVTHDVTERRTVERLERLLAAIVESSDDAILSSTLDGLIQSWNRGAETIFGYAATETVGQHISVLLAPEHAGAMARLISQVSRGIPVCRSQLLGLRKDRKRLQVSVALRLIGESGVGVAALSLTFRDISEQAELEEKKMLLTSIVESSDDAIITKTLDGVITSWNPAAETVFGYSVGEAIGRHISLIIPPDRLAEETHIMERLRKGEAVEHFETTRLGKGGREVDFSLTVSPVRDEKGYVVGASKLLRDIGQRRRSEASFRTFVKSTPIAMIMINSEGHITLVNDQAAHLFGYAPSELQEQPVRLLVPELFRTKPGAEHVDYSNLASQELGNPPAQRIEKRRDLRGLRKDQIEFPLEVSVNAARIEEGFIVLSLVDLTGSKRAEEQLRKYSAALECQVSERTVQLKTANKELEEVRGRLQAVLSSPTAAAIIALDCQGTIKLFNHGAERMLQYKAGEVIDCHQPSLFLTKAECARRSEKLTAMNGRRVAEDEIFEASILPAHSYSHETVYLRHDGTPVDVNAVVSPMFDSGGQRVGTLAIAIDIAQSKLLEKQLNDVNGQLLNERTHAEKANRAKSDFLSAMSHEIRTPMNSILGIADLLWETELDAKQRQYVEVFRRAGGNLLTLVNNLLDLSKIESAHFELEQIEFDMRELIERTFEMIRPKAKAKGIVLTSRVEPGTHAALVGDPARLQQILINLLANALKFTEQGEIILTLGPDASDPNRWHFDVTDTGIGIPEDKLDSIFEDFTQAEDSTTRRFGGTGLGLGICRRLLRYMGGHLKVSSAVGKGSSFYFEAAFAPCPRNRPRRPTLLTDLVGRRVLIVDDNSTHQLIVGDMLRMWGMWPSVCASAGSALAALEMLPKDEQFDLIILNPFMGEVNCFDLALQIRRVKLNVPIIMTTSDNVPGDQTMSRQLGIGGYIVEPVRRGELLRLVCGVLGEAGVEKQGRGAILDVAPNDAENICPVQILIADDSEDNRFLMQEYLAHTSSKITFVENGEQAVHMAQSQQFDLIFMDIHMPVMDGLTATKLIRRAEQEAGGGQIPVLALTAGACKEDIEACRAAGCSAHISKPISKEKILSSINKYVQRIEPPKTPYPSLTNIPLGRETAAKRYTERRKAEVSCLVRLLEERDFAHLRTLAHNMKGTGKPYGFPEITRIGAALEDAAKQRDAVGIDQHLAALSAYLERASMNVASGDITRHTIARSVSTEMLSTACVDGTPRPADVS